VERTHVGEQHRHAVGRVVGVVLADFAEFSVDHLDDRRSDVRRRLHGGDHREHFLAIDDGHGVGRAMCRVAPGVERSAIQPRAARVRDLIVD
jgi:hypothetical protein